MWGLIVVAVLAQAKTPQPTGVTSLGGVPSTRTISTGTATATGLSGGGTLAADRSIVCDPASATSVGCVTTGTQTMAGAKTFSTSVASPAFSSSAASGSAAYGITTNGARICMDSTCTRYFSDSGTTTTFTGASTHTGILTVNGNIYSTGGFVGTDTVQDFNSVGALTLKGTMSDGASAIAVTSKSSATWANSAAKIHSFQNNTTEKAYVGIAGNFHSSAASGAEAFGVTTNGARFCMDSSCARYLSDNGTTTTFTGILTGTGALTLSASSGNTLVVNTNDLVVDSTNHRVGIGTASPSAFLHLVDTLPTDGAATVNGVSFNLASSSGGSGRSQTGLNLALTSGYTGGFATQTMLAVNTAASSVNSLSNNNANFGFRGQSQGVGAANVGAFGAASNGTSLNVGNYGQSISVTNGAVNIGVLGQALNTGTSPTQIGGYFILSGADPGNFTNAALIADNGSTTSSIFVAKDNGTAVLTVADGGGITATGAYTSSVASGSNAIVLGTGARLKVGGGTNDYFVSDGSGIKTPGYYQVGGTLYVGTGNAGSGLIAQDAGGTSPLALQGGATSTTIVKFLNGTGVEKSKIDTSGNYENEIAGQGVIMASPNGTRYQLTVSNAGALVITAL